MGAPPTKNSVAAKYLQDKSFVEMDVRAKRKNGTPIRLRPGTAKYPAESTFNKVSEGMCGQWTANFFFHRSSSFYSENGNPGLYKHSVIRHFSNRLSRCRHSNLTTRKANRIQDRVFIQFLMIGF